MKKEALMFTVALLALAVAGCAGTGTPTAHPTDTTPSTLPTQTAPTATPAPVSWLNGYTEDVRGMTQRLPGTEVPQVECTLEAVYHTGNWMMPAGLRTYNGSAEHGAIYKLLFHNPTGSAYTIVAGDTIKSDIQYYYGGMAYVIGTSDIFYDPGTDTQYSTFDVPAGQSREVYLLAYVTSNAAYDAYGSYINLESIDLNPHYQPY